MDTITFELNGTTYEIPETLSIGDYTKIFKVKDLFEDEYLKAKVINLITNCPMDDLIEAENHKVEFLATTLFAMVPAPPYGFTDRFTLEGVEYGYLPSYKEITFGEFADLDTLLTKKPEEIMEYLHIIAAIMYRPIISQKSKHNFKIEKYNQESMNERAELFKNKLDVRFALGGQFFFINFAKTYLDYTPRSLKWKIMREWEIAKFFWQNKRLIWNLLSKKDSDGMSSLIEWHRTTLMSTTKSFKKLLSKY